MKLRKCIGVALLAAAVMTVGTEASAASLPAPDDVNASWYGDGLVYSLPLLNLIATNNASELNGPFTVSSSPGQIAPEVVILTGTEGNLVLNNKTPSGPFPNKSALADNPFAAPTGAQSTTFSTQSGNPGSAPEPDPLIPGDGSDSWDILVSSLLSFLGGNDLVYFFDNNQEGSGTGIGLNIWAQIQLVDTDGILPTLCFEIHGTPNALSGNPGDKTAPGGAPAPVATCAPGNQDPNTLVPGAPVNPQGVTTFVHVDSGFCVNKTTGDAEPCDGGNTPGPNQWGQVTNNLGNSRAEFAVEVPRLNDCLQDALCIAGYDVLRHVIFYNNNNDGADQIWISSAGTNTPPTVPAPAAMLLLGAGLIGARIAGRRLRRTK
jgi:hypothetical protein